MPYPGTLGMEKEKPYGCEVCGKRYKNLNGLKYHKAHSPPCNPEKRVATGPGNSLTGTMAGSTTIDMPGLMCLGAPFEEHGASTAF